MKVFSITFQSLSEPTKTAIYSTIANNIDEAYKIGIDKLIKEQGDLMWRPTMHTALDVQINVLQPISPSPDINKIAEDPLKESQNWLLNIIIKNNDLDLFNTSKKYLSENEKLLIENKICKK